mmetsp:Transcript_34107/g.77251  ORF Transcript_34107/g.77251 Transcript_34107/m.77251 type:complete len:210 (-) Transcript_34107:577-1206(-)
MLSIPMFPVQVALPIAITLPIAPPAPALILAGTLRLARIPAMTRTATAARGLCCWSHLSRHGRFARWGWLGALVVLLVEGRHRLLATRLVPQLRDGLGEVNLDTAVVYEGAVHLKVRLRARLNVVELDKRVVQRVARLEVTDHLTRFDLAEPPKYYFQIVVFGDRVELADEEHILGRRQVRVGQITQHLEHLCTRCRRLVLQRLLDLFR